MMYIKIPIDWVIWFDGTIESAEKIAEALGGDDWQVYAGVDTDKGKIYGKLYLTTVHEIVRINEGIASNRQVVYPEDIVEE